LGDLGGQFIPQFSNASFSHCCLNVIIKELVDEFTAMAIAAEITLKVEVPSSGSLEVMGHSEQLYRAIANLLSNAIQYTPPKGTVTLVLAAEPPIAMIRVRDTGIGISLNDQQRIFDRFYRVDRERSIHKGGSGLGLAIVQAIAQTHKGSLQVQSQLGKGSQFTLSLPLLTANRGKEP
jgi:signal transduction histidine kinase